MNSKPRKAEQGLLEAFQHCKSYLARIVGSIVQPHDVEDIVQETFLKSYEACNKSRVRHPKAFMVKTATNLALNWVTKPDRRLTDSLGNFAYLNVSSDKESVENRVEMEQKLLIFCRAAQRMPLQCRRAFILKKVYGLRREEIAKYMGISEKTVQHHVAKGTLMCTEYMEERGMPFGNAYEKEKHG